MKRLLTPLLVLLLCTCARAQETPPVRLIAKPLGDAVALRWAPTDYGSLRLLRLHGALVERRRLGDKAGFRPLGERRLAYTLNDFRGLADTNDVHVIAVAEALYGEAAPGTRPGELGAVLDEHEEQQQRLFLALVNADLSAAAARCLGWSYVDKTAEPGVPYEYRLRLPWPDGEGFSAPVRQRSSDHYDDTPPDKFRLEAAEGRVLLRWSGNDAGRFSGYHLERSADGQNWTRALDVPLLAEPDEEGFLYAVDVPAGTAPYSLRLRGIDPFGWVSPPTAAVRTETLDTRGPAAPTSLRGEGLPDGVHALEWSPAQPASGDLAGFRILRGLSVDGPFAAVTRELLPPDSRTWRDTEPLAGRTNFYAVEAVDEVGNATRSPVNFVRPHDDTPPATPVGLTGRIDTLGRVFLLWEPGAEPDLLGYRVYRSHARDREFLQVTEAVQHRNFFFDSTTLLVLNETILYRIVAVDRHYNPSGYSAVLELRRPDKVAPAAPAISGYSVRGTTVELRIRPSESGDVVRQTVWRAGPERMRPLVAIGPRDTVYHDTTTAPRTRYTYTVRAEDEVGLFGTSPALTVRSGLVAGGTGVTGLARTQERGEDQEALRWTAPTDPVAGFQLFGGDSATSLRPLRRLPPDLREWPVPDAAKFYALQTLFADGRRGPLSQVVGPINR